MEKLKILFITDNFPPETNAPATRTFEHIRSWIQSDNQLEVHVLTCFPNFPIGRVFNGYKNKLYQYETLLGINIHRVWSYISANSGFIKRTLDFLSFAFSSLFFAIFKIPKCDIVIATSPQFFTLLSGLFYAKLFGKFYIVEIRDLWPKSIFDLGMLSNNLIQRLFFQLERYIYEKCNLIITVTPPFKDYITNLGINNEKIFVISNGFSDSFINSPRKSILKFSDQNAIRIGYIGTLGEAHALENILDGFKLINGLNERIELHFIGEGSEKQTLIHKVESEKIQNVFFHGAIVREMISGTIQDIDFTLAHLRDIDAFKTVVPSKIFESIAIGKPVLMGSKGYSAELVKNLGIGVVFEPESPEAFFQIVKGLVEGKYDVRKMKINCESSQNKYRRDKLALKMLMNIKSQYKKHKMLKEK